MIREFANIVDNCETKQAKYHKYDIIKFEKSKFSKETAAFPYPTATKTPAAPLYRNVIKNQKASKDVCLPKLFCRSINIAYSARFTNPVVMVIYK
jgi:hypothetical protein